MDVLIICSVALKIHVSPQCKQLLDKLGTYQTEKRGFVNVKVSDISIQFANLNHTLLTRCFFVVCYPKLGHHADGYRSGIGR